MCCSVLHVGFSLPVHDPSLLSIPPRAFVWVHAHLIVSLLCGFSVLCGGWGLCLVAAFSCYFVRSPIEINNVTSWVKIFLHGKVEGYSPQNPMLSVIFTWQLWITWIIRATLLSIPIAVEKPLHFFMLSFRKHLAFPSSFRDVVSSEKSQKARIWFCNWSTICFICLFAVCRKRDIHP